MQALQTGVLRKDGKQQDCYQLPRAAPIAFKALMAFLIFASAPSPSAFNQSQLKGTFADCKKYVFESMKQLVIMSRQPQPDEIESYEAVYSEGLLALMLANLQSKLSSYGDTFYLTELYNDFAVKMVGDKSRSLRLTSLHTCSNIPSANKPAYGYTRRSSIFAKKLR